MFNCVKSVKMTNLLFVKLYVADMNREKKRK